MQEATVNTDLVLYSYKPDEDDQVSTLWLQTETDFRVPNILAFRMPNAYYEVETWELSIIVAIRNREQ